MSNYNQSLIEDYRQTIERLQKECTEKTNAIIALGEHLKAKTQECEELRSECGELFNAKLEILRDLDHYKRAYYGCSKRIEEHLVIRAPLPPPEFVDSRYRKALEEIEEYIKRDCGCECTYCLEQGDCKFQDILDIINKAKGEG